MSKLVKTLTVVALLVGVIAVMPGTAEARHRGHGGWGHHWRGWGGGYPYGYYPYAYYPRPYYYAAPCGWVRYRVWRHGYWILRRGWRCW